MGHIVFMCHYKKTTNEALKRSEKYGYAFEQFQISKYSNGVLHMLWHLYQRKTVRSLISNKMVKDMYKQKIDYIDINLNLHKSG